MRMFTYKQNIKLEAIFRLRKDTEMRVYGDVCMMTYVWRHVYVDVCMETCVCRRVCRRVYGDVCMETCVCRRVYVDVCM